MQNGTLGGGSLKRGAVWCRYCEHVVDSMPAKSENLEAGAFISVFLRNLLEERLAVRAPTSKVHVGELERDLCLAVQVDSIRGSSACHQVVDIEISLELRCDCVVGCLQVMLDCGSQQKGTANHAERNSGETKFLQIFRMCCRGSGIFQPQESRNVAVRWMIWRNAFSMSAVMATR